MVPLLAQEAPLETYATRSARLGATIRELGVREASDEGDGHEPEDEPHARERDRRPRIEEATILRDHLDALRSELAPEQLKVAAAILSCRTSELGGHLQSCGRCGDVRPAYNSCRNRHCPRCQALRQDRWLLRRLSRALPVPYFHVVLTIPARLRRLFFENPRVLYSALLRAAGRTTLDVVSDTLRGAEGGAIAVLHTWNRRNKYHVHVHCLVPAGGLAADGRWLSSEESSLLPLDELRPRFQAAVVSAIRRALDEGTLEPASEDGLAALLDDVARPECYWHVYAKRTLRSAEEALSYLARYATRVGLGNGRILSYDGKTVRIATKNGEHEDVPALEYLRRRFLHVLPRGLMRIRYYGILCGRAVREGGKLERARRALEEQGLECPASPLREGESWQEQLKRLTGIDVNVCPRCEGDVRRIPFRTPREEQWLLARLEQEGKAEAPP